MEHSALTTHLISNSPPKPVCQLRRADIDRMRSKYLLESVAFKIREYRQLKSFLGKIVERVTFNDSTELFIIENSRFSVDYSSRDSSFACNYKDFIAVVVSNDEGKSGLASNSHPAVKFFIDILREKRERLVASALAL